MKTRTRFLAGWLAVMMLFSVIVPILPIPVTAAEAEGVAPEIGGQYMIVAKHSGKAMTVSGYTDNASAGIVQMEAMGYKSQVWKLEDGDTVDGVQYYELVNLHSGKSLNVAGNSNVQGTQMVQWYHHSADNEKWSFTATNDGYYSITPKINPDMGLNINAASTYDGAAVIQWNYGGQNNELWSFVPVTEALDNPVAQEPDMVKAIDAYIKKFFYVEDGVGKLRNMPDNGFWTDAEVLEVFIDAYEIIGDPKYLETAEQFYDGFVARRSTDWSGNGFNDDVLWMTLATIRLYKNTGNTEYRDVAKANFDMCYARAWDTTFLNGGLWWTTDNKSKNACVNGPGALAALLIYETTKEIDYYNKGKAIVDWMIEYMYLEENGEIIDTIYIPSENKEDIRWMNTGNQGNLIGACAMLYKYTNDITYYNVAKKAADCVATLGDGEYKILNEGNNSGDSIGGKGLLARWLGYFVRECNVTDYNTWIYNNAKAAWNNRNSDDLMWGEFDRRTEEYIENSSTRMDPANPEAVNLTKGNYASWGCSAGVSWLLNMQVDGWQVFSPDGDTVMTVYMSDNGELTYSVMQEGVTVVEASQLGINTSVGDFTTGLTFVSQENTVVNETYDVISGKKSSYTNHCSQKTLRFTKGDVAFDLVTRVYDDGIAFRYVITTASGQEMTVQPNAEITSFDLPDASKIWYMPRGGTTYVPENANDNGTSFMYEDDYQTATIGKVEAGIQPSLPMLYETNGKYGLIMEADRHGTYVGSLLELEEGGVMRTIFDLTQTSAVSTTTPFTSPWRTVIIGSAADIMMNTMVENLSPAPDAQYDFESWVDPGLSSWSWVSYYGGQEDPDIHKKFIDLAADMGWKYYILDERWQPESTTGDSRYEGMHDWFEDVRDYANEKGVKLFAWVDKQDVDTDAEREARFKEWSAAGIVGIKVDFFYYDSQEILQLHDDIYADAAKYKLMVNVHGSNPSSGEIRTYPNVITREAIKGQEQGGITVDQYTLIPFIRAAVGSADVTEQLYSRDTGKTTMGFQIALSTLIQNGLHSMGDKPENYYSVPAAVSYYTNFPSTWDDMYVFEDITAVGEEVNLARKSGDTWYAAGISVNAKTYSYKPEFLDAGKTYTAIIYKEPTDQRQNLEMQIVENVTADTDLSVSVQAGGGYAIKFVSNVGSELNSITATPSHMNVEAYYSKQVVLEFDPVDTTSTDVVWNVADPTIAQISPTGKGVSIKGLKVGMTTVTATSIYDENIKAVINVNVTPAQYLLNDTWTVFKDNANYIVKGENKVTITAENGVIDHNIFAMEATDTDFEITAKISGGLNANYQGGFIGVFDADGNPYVSVGRRYHTGFNRNDSYNLIAMMSNNSEQYVADPNANGDMYVRLVKNGDTFTGYYRQNADGEWITADTFTLTHATLAATNPLYVGFYAGCGGSTNGIDITISEFTYKGNAANVAARNPDAVKGVQTFEAEKMTINGGEPATNENFSGNGYVGYIGGANNNTATFTVTSDYKGKATLYVYYATWEDRQLSVTVGDTVYKVDCPATGDWTLVGEPVEVVIDVANGSNTIVLGGVDGGNAPNLDKVEIVLPTEAFYFYSASLTLQTNLQVNYRVNKSLFTEGGYSNPYVVFVMNGEKTIVSEYTEEETKYVFRFKNIGPKMMNDTITATLHADYSGVECTSDTFEYSVATYCYNKLTEYENKNDSYSTVFRTLLVDLLNYGTAAQEYLDYNTENLANAKLTNEQKAWGTSDENLTKPQAVTNIRYETIANPTVGWRSARLNLGDTVRLGFKISADSTEGLSVKIRSGEDEWTVTKFTVTDDGYYDIIFDGLNARQMRDAVYVTVYKDGVAVSNTLSYSIGSYANSKWNSTNAELATLVKAIMKYGDSAKAYVESLSN